MADSAQNKDTDFLKSSDTDKGGLLGQIDTGVYKQLLIFLGLSIILATGFYIYLRFGQEPASTPSTTTPSQATTSAYNQTKTKFSLDQQRKIDTTTINSALKSYFLSHKAVPKSLKELVPKNLAELPTDPETKKDYTYTPSEDFKTWKVGTTLSDDTLFEVEGP